MWWRHYRVPRNSQIERHFGYPAEFHNLSYLANRPGEARAINQAISFGVTFQTDPLPTLDSWNKKGTMFLICSHIGVGFMLRLFVEEAAALASISLFIGMIAVWAQVIPQL